MQTTGFRMTPPVLNDTRKVTHEFYLSPCCAVCKDFFWLILFCVTPTLVQFGVGLYKSLNAEARIIRDSWEAYNHSHWKADTLTCPALWMRQCRNLYFSWISVYFPSNVHLAYVFKHCFEVKHCKTIHFLKQLSWDTTNMP